MSRAYAVYSVSASRTWRAAMDRLDGMKNKPSMVVLAANLRALKEATPLGINSGNRAVAKAAAIGEGSVARARNGDGNTTMETLDALARYYKCSAWELLCPQFRPGIGLRLVTDDDIRAEVDRRLLMMMKQYKDLEGMKQ